MNHLSTPHTSCATNRLLTSITEVKEMVKQMAKLAAVLLFVHAISTCHSLDTESKVRVITRKAKQHSLLTEELLGGKPMNMTEEPKAVMNGLCPQGCSKCIASVPYLCTCRTSINENTLTFILLQHFFFYSVHFLLHTASGPN